MTRATHIPRKQVCSCKALLPTIAAYLTVPRARDERKHCGYSQPWYVALHYRISHGVDYTRQLAWKLAYVLKGLSKDDILDSYPTERLPIVAEMLNMTTELYSKTFSGEIAREALANKEKADRVDESEGGKGTQKAWFDVKKLSQLDINYRWSDIIHDDRICVRSSH